MALPQNEIEKTTPTVQISGTEVDDLHCVRVTKRTGISPSTAEMHYLESQDSVGPRTLTNGGSYKHKQRCLIYTASKSQIWFQGWLTKRRDQHAQNTVIWTANDDTILLRQLYTKGCYVLDTLIDKSRVLKYSAALNTVFNPKGAFNCTFVTIGEGENAERYPVFSPTAIYGQAYTTPDQVGAKDPDEDGTIVPWTCRRILRYLQLVMHSRAINGGLVPGEAALTDGTGSIKEDYLRLTKAHIMELVGIDTGIVNDDNVDPLDIISQQLSVQGDSLIGAFIKALKLVGTHQLATSYDLNKIFPTTGMTDGGRTNLIFQPIGYYADGKNIGIQFDSLVNKEEGTMYDFSLSEDSLDTTRKIYLEGKVKNLETQLWYTGDPETDTIVPAWSEEEEQSFYRVFTGQIEPFTLGKSPRKWALIPKLSGVPSSAPGDYTESNGTSGTEKIKAMDDAALALAHQSYPTVFRAFSVKTVGDLADAIGSQGLIHPRKILPQQLQFLSWRAAELGDVQLRASLPVRLSIQVTHNTPYYDVPKDTAIRVTTDVQGDNLIWLDGAGTAVDDTVECIYGPGFRNDFYAINGGKVIIRNFKINCAMPLDDRVEGIARQIKNNEYYEKFSDDFEDAYEDDAPFIYLDAPDSYRWDKQIDSYPSRGVKFYGGVNGTDEISQPLTRDVPPGRETDSAGYAAMRELSKRRHPSRNSSWKQAGIIHTVQAGDWLKYVYVYKNGVATNYLVDGAINTIIWDFLAQTTTVGDVFSDVGSMQY